MLDLECPSTECKWTGVVPDDVEWCPNCGSHLYNNDLPVNVACPACTSDAPTGKIVFHAPPRCAKREAGAPMAMIAGASR